MNTNGEKRAVASDELATAGMCALGSADLHTQYTPELHKSQAAIRPLGTFPAEIYRGWVAKYPDSPQVKTWLATADGLAELVQEALTPCPAPKMRQWLPRKEDIPAELLAYRNWVAWREIPNGNKKPRKPPVDPHTGRMAESDNPATWGTFDEALAYAKTHGLAGVGFVLTNTPYVGTDLDNIIDPLTGKINPAAAALLEVWHTYSEISPSGKGIKAIGRGKLDKHALHSAGFIEVYDEGRYFTITGRLVDGMPTEINDVAVAIERTQAQMHQIRDDQAREAQAKNQLANLSQQAGAQRSAAQPAGDTAGHVAWALGKIAPWRNDDYTPAGAWLGVGMAIHSAMPGPDGLALWDNWSKGSAKYMPGLCEKKWATFTAGRGLTVASLYHWAKQDSGERLPWTRDDAQPSDALGAAVVAATMAAHPPAPKTPEEAPRLNICGVRVEYPDPHAPNQIKRKVLVCGDYRSCEFCAKTRGRDLRARIETALQAGPVFVARLNVKLARALVRKLGKENCMRLPIDDDTVVIFNQGDGGQGTEIMPDGLPELAYFVDLVRAVMPDKRITGKLGDDDETENVTARPARDEYDGAEPIMVKMISHTADRETAAKLYAAAWARCERRVLGMSLDTGLQVEKALDLVTTEYKRLIRMAGYQVEHQITREIPCHLARILTWKDTYVLNDTAAPQGAPNEPGSHSART